MIFPGKLNLHLRLEETCSHTLEMVEVFILSFVCRCFCHCFCHFSFGLSFCVMFFVMSLLVCHFCWPFVCQCFCHLSFGMSFCLSFLSSFLCMYVCVYGKNIKNYKKIQNMTTKWQKNDNASRKMCFCNLQICICLSFVVKLCHFFRTYHQNDKKYNKMANK